LWCFPERPLVGSSDPKKLATIDHGFTHFRLRIHPVLHEVRKGARIDFPGLWVDLDDALRAAIPTPVKNLLQELQRNATRGSRSRR